MACPGVSHGGSRRLPFALMGAKQVGGDAGGNLAAHLADMAVWTVRAVNRAKAQIPGGARSVRLRAFGRPRRLRSAWVAGVALCAATVVVTLPTGLLRPIAIAVYAIVPGLPVLIAWWRLARRG